MTIEVWCQTDVGLRRERNEDSFLFDEEIGLYVVADGMGGHRGGEVASRMAVETLQEYLRRAFFDAGSRKVNPRSLLVQAYEKASERIYERSLEGASELYGMGTTLVAALWYGDTLYIANVGDSRAYLFSHNCLWQLTEDHSLVNEQLRAGIISEKDLGRFAAKNVITRSVGFEKEVQADVIERQMQPGELVLMCSDGLSGLVADGQIADFCRAHQPSELVPVCIEEAKRNGGDDNVTVMALYAQPRSN